MRVESASMRGTHESRITHAHGRCISFNDACQSSDLMCASPCKRCRSIDD